jgi:hypothetical protein
MKYISSATSTWNLLALLRTRPYSIPGLNINNTDWVSVRSLGPNGAKGRRAIAIEKPTGMLNCTLSNDIALTTLVPASSMYNSCMGLDAIPVTVTLKNTGVNAISNIPVNMQVDANPVISETYTGTIPPNDSAAYTFTALADVSAPGMHEIKSWLTLPGDENPYNDTLFNNISVSIASSVIMPVYENFESFTTCETSNDCEIGVCALTNGWTNVTNLAGDQIDWRTSFGPTPGNNTGPDVDFDPGTATGKYIYLEAGGGCKNSEAQLLSPCIDLSQAQQPQLTFAYHLYGNDMGELHVDAFANGSWVEDITAPVIGDQGNQWFTDTVDLTAFTGEIVTIRFRGITGSGATSDMALDAIGINEAEGVVTALFTYSGSLCVDSIITFTSTSTGTINSYAWDFGAGANPATASTAGPHEVVYSNSGNKTVMLTVNGSSSSDTENGIVTITDHTVASFAYTISNLTYTFTNTSTNAASYLWDFGDGATSTLPNPSHTYAVSGTYTITLTATGGCGTDVNIQTIVATGIEVPVNPVINIYPNPSDGIFNVSLNASLINALSLSVYEITGRKLFDISKETMLRNRTVHVDLSMYASGIYFLRVNNNNEEWNYKLIR